MERAVKTLIGATFFVVAVCIISGRECFAADFIAPAPIASLSTISPEPIASFSSISPVAPQKVLYQQCNKIFNLNCEKLFYLTLASVNANRFKIVEIQSRSGYIKFFAAQQEFLVSVLNVDSNHAILKVTPCNNSYFFPIGIVTNIFRYIELNLSTPIINL